jgi:hypothetical protein
VELLLLRMPSATSEDAQWVQKARGVRLRLRSTLWALLRHLWLLRDLVTAERVRELPAGARVMGSELAPAADLWRPSAVHGLQGVVHALVRAAGFVQQVHSSLHRFGSIRLGILRGLTQSSGLPGLSVRLSSTKDSANQTAHLLLQYFKVFGCGDQNQLVRPGELKTPLTAPVGSQ